MDFTDIRKFIYVCPPELAHDLAVLFFRSTSTFPWMLNYCTCQNFVADPILEQEMWGKKFLNPIGLAAGFDKNAHMLKAMIALGFGFTEVGTVTPLPQSGNPKPRIARFVEQESIQNAMGFNNDGAVKVAQRLQKLYPFVTPVGVNIGKNKATPDDKALDDYEKLIKSFKDLCDYMVINISSPNTPNLRDLQNENFIKAVFEMAKKHTDKPVLLKLAPDMEIADAIKLGHAAVDAGCAGIIANNTSTDYSLLPVSQGLGEKGGISGAVIKEKSYNFFRGIAEELFERTVLISVGGIDTAEEIYRRIKAGANFVQIYSVLIYKGPHAMRDMNNALVELLKKDGYDNISHAVGADLKK